MHLSHNVGEQSNHIIVSHGHISYNLFQCNFLGGVVLVLLAATKKLLTQLSYFALSKWVSTSIFETDEKAAAKSLFFYQAAAKPSLKTPTHKIPSD